MIGDPVSEEERLFNVMSDKQHSFGLALPDPGELDLKHLLGHRVKRAQRARP